MRVVIFGIAASILIGCAPVQREFTGFQVAMGPCKSRYAAWRNGVEAHGAQTASPAAAVLLACMRAHGVRGPITIVTREVYGATPPPRFGPGKPRRDMDVWSVDVIATHYTATPQ